MTAARTLEDRVRAAAERLKISDQIAVRMAGRILQISTPVGVEMLTSNQGKQLLRGCGVSYPVRLSVGYASGWLGATDKGCQFVVIATRAVQR